MSVEGKISIFNIKSVNTEFIITIHDHYTTVSGLVKKNGGSYSETSPCYSDCDKFNSYLIDKIRKKLLGNTIEKIGNIENHEYLYRDGVIIRKFIFETDSINIIENSINPHSIENPEQDISGTEPINKFIRKFTSEIESINIIENSINSIIKIIDNKKFVITAFNDDVFITNIGENYTIYHSYDNESDIFKSTSAIYPPSQYYFSQIQKEVFARHCSDVQKVR